MNLKIKATWNYLKMGICATIPALLMFYGWDLWINAVSPLVDKFNNPKTPEQAVLYLCIVAGFIAPIFFIFPASRFGLWLGKVLGIFKDSKTQYLVFDDVSYFVGHMTERQREEIKELLEGYRSKTQLRKDAKKNQSWFRRNFT